MENSNPPQTSKVILLAEDEVFIRDIYQRILEQSGYKILPVGNGEDTLTEAQKQPNLILLDIMMPKMNGIDVLKKLKSDPGTSHIPVVLLTNLGAENVIKEAYKLGVQGYIIKMHITPYQLAGQVKRFLEDPNYVIKPPDDLVQG